MKDTTYVICKPLTYVINLSMQTGEFPEDLKAARVSPIFKSGAKNTFGNYRPINVLPSLLKIFEKCVHHQLMNYLEQHNLLSKCQFGYRRKWSTEHAITLFTNQIRKAMDKGQMTGAIFVDFSKAFDTISHASIINKLPSYGLCGTSQQWITSYLFARTQCVSYKGTLSSPSYMYCGVPQGSILKAQLIMNLKKGKTVIMLFGTDQRIRRLENSTLQIQHNDLTVNMTYLYKYLSVTLTSSLSMTDHLNTAIKKASCRIHLLKKMRSHMDSKTAKLIHQSMIVPILTYCPLSLYGLIPSYLKNRINAMEARTQLIIGNENEVAKSEIINKKHSCLFVHKCLHTDQFNDHFGDYFTLKSTNVSTQDNGTKLVMPKIKLEIARKSAFYQGAMLFNSLPKEIRANDDFEAFKSSLDDFF